MKKINLPNELAINEPPKGVSLIEEYFFEVFDSLKATQDFKAGKEVKNSSFDNVRIPDQADTVEIYTQVDSGSDYPDRLYSKGIHLANRTGIYAIVWTEEDKSCWNCGKAIHNDKELLIRNGAIGLFELFEAAIEKPVLGLWCSKECFNKQKNDL